MAGWRRHGRRGEGGLRRAGRRRHLVAVVDPNRETIENNLEWLEIIGDPVIARGRNFPPERIGIVLNKARNNSTWGPQQVRDVFRRYRFLGAVPLSAALQDAANDGHLLSHSHQAVDAALARILHTLTGNPTLAAIPETAVVDRRGSGLLGWIQTRTGTPAT